MFKPKFNHVLVEIDDKDGKWGKGNDDSFGGETFREGKLLELGEIFSTADHPLTDDALIDIYERLNELVGKTIMWNEGHEAGKVFEHGDKKYALVYWHDIVGVKSSDE